MIALISYTSKVMLKILQADLQQCMNYDLSNVQDGLRKGRRSRDQIANICWVIEKARELKKKSTSALLIMPKPLTVLITTDCKILRDGNTRPPDLPAEKLVFRFRSNSQNWT